MDRDVEERLALFMDFENVAIGARQLGLTFRMGPLLEALADRGRLLVRRAYADWNLFSEYRRELVDAHVELIEIPQRDDEVRKNAADIKLAVDAMELALGSTSVSTFVIVSGDSDFTPLVSKLRELNKRVIGVGMQGSTSALLPPACDEFIFYDRLESVRSSQQASRRGHTTATGAAEPQPNLVRLVTQTLAGLQRTSTGPVLASNLKRALLRRDPTFSEADHGFRAFGELLRHLAEEGHLVLRDGSAPGDPEVDFPESGAVEERAFGLLREVVAEIASGGATPVLSGLKDQLRKREPDFSEKDLGYSGFLQFCRAAAARGVVELRWDDTEQDYVLAAT